MAVLSHHSQPVNINAAFSNAARFPEQRLPACLGYRLLQPPSSLSSLQGEQASWR